MNPIEELARMLPSASASRELPRRRQHESDLLAVMAAEPPSRRWLGPAAAAAAVVIVAVLALTVPRLISDSGRADGTKLTATRQWSVPAQRLRRIILSTPAGSITVTPGGRATASVIATPSYQRSAPVITSRVSGGTLMVAVTCPQVSRKCQVSLKLSAPTGVRVTATTDLGDIRLSGIAGPVSARTADGSISAIGLAAPRATLTTDLGNVDALFWVPPRLVTASSQDGAVTIRLPSTVTYDVAASTQLGRIDVSVPRSASSAHVIRATSQLGSVTVSG